MARPARGTPRPGPAFTFIGGVVRPLLVLLFKRDWQGRENVPRTGGLVVVVNHYSFFDPISVGHFLVVSGRTPRFLAKAGVFKQPTLGKLFRAAGQIPVYRESRDAALAFREAVAAVERGESIVVYPEGTRTLDPDLWPMAGKTGAARIALRTGAPVLPVAQWGAQDVFGSYQSKRPKLFPRKTLRVAAGQPIDLSQLVGKEMTAEALRVATEHVMDTVTGLLAGIRGEQPPPVRFDPLAAKAGADAQGEPAVAVEAAEPAVADAPTGPDAPDAPAESAEPRPEARA